jgi:hypothetical protein
MATLLDRRLRRALILRSARFETPCFARLLRVRE